MGVKDVREELAKPAFREFAPCGTVILVPSAAFLMHQIKFCASHEGCSSFGDQIEGRLRLQVTNRKGVHFARGASCALHLNVQPPSRGEASIPGQATFGWMCLQALHPSQQLAGRGSKGQM